MATGSTYSKTGCTRFMDKGKKMNGEFKPGEDVAKDELLVVAGDAVGYTIVIEDDDDTEGLFVESIIVWDNPQLRDRIIELLNKYGVGDE